MATAISFESRLMDLRSSMLNFALMLTSNREAASDLLQDTMLKALDNRDKYAENSNFKGWVFTIMRSIFISNYRHIVRHAVVGECTDDPESLNLTDGSDKDSPEASYRSGEVQDAISAFPDKFRVPFSMHVSGYRPDEIAAEMHLPIATVRSRIATAQRMLRDRLA